ncbi:thioredoxin reductase [Acrasis kona]|uniref:Thioredoxin reductase n=1 Tax=Acrasis kona TaxID=1008807 RepID=A0AAW2ZPC8_9EUKA
MSMKSVHKARSLMSKLNSLSVVDENKEYEMIHTLMGCYSTNKADPILSELVCILEKVLKRHDELEAKNMEIEEANKKLKEKVEFIQSHTLKITNKEPRTSQLITSSPRNAMYSPRELQKPPVSASQHLEYLGTSNTPTISPINSPYCSPRDVSWMETSPRRQSTVQGLSSSKILSVNNWGKPDLEPQQTQQPHTQRKQSSNAVMMKRVLSDLNDVQSNRERGLSDPTAYRPLKDPEVRYIASSRWEPSSVRT